MNLDDQGLPALDQFSEEGFVDCVFKVDGLEGDQEFYDFRLLASHGGRRVGFGVKLLRTVGPGLDSEVNLIQEHVYQGGAVFRSLGEMSDDLIRALADLYGMGGSELRMVAEESFTVIALEQGDTDFELRAVRMKLFGRDDEPFVEEDYYESFFNVDLPGGFAYWNEKDPDYRAALIRALGGG